MATPKPKIGGAQRTRGKRNERVNFIKSLIGEGNSLDSKTRARLEVLSSNLDTLGTTL